MLSQGAGGTQKISHPSMFSATYPTASFYVEAVVITTCTLNGILRFEIGLVGLKIST